MSWGLEGELWKGLVTAWVWRLTGPQVRAQKNPILNGLGVRDPVS